jgi:RNA polymerase sigma-70 factor (ECF subfamily)
MEAQTMPGSANSSSSVTALTFAGASQSSRPSALEEEVTRLFDELRNPILRYVLSLGLSPQDGEEVIQEVFLALFQHMRQGKSRHNLRGWVFRVAHNLALKRRCARALVSLTDVDAASQTLDPDPNPEEALAAKQRRARLCAVFRALPEQDRCCLYLRAEGLRYREIAEVLGISLGAVSLSLVRSLTRLSRADGSEVYAIR